MTVWKACKKLSEFRIGKMAIVLFISFTKRGIDSCLHFKGTYDVIE